MAISPLVQPLCRFLGILGLGQGLIFFTLSLLGVLAHQCTITVAPDETLTTFVPLVVGLYFQGADCEVYNATVLHKDYFSDLVTPEWLFIWMAVYIGASGFWIIFSVLIMIDHFHKNNTLHHVLPFWIILAIGNCAMDLALAVYFGLDFTHLFADIEVHGSSLLPVVPFMMLMILLRGGVLWLINFFGSISAVVALINFINHKNDDKLLFLERAGFLDRTPIDGFAPIEMPRPMTLPLSSNVNSNGGNVATISALRNYYMTHEEPRSGFQSPISEAPPLNKWKKQTLWDIPDPDYSPTSTVTGLKNETDSQPPGLRHSLFNPTLPLRPSLKKTQHDYERKEDISL